MDLPFPRTPFRARLVWKSVLASVLLSGVLGVSPLLPSASAEDASTASATLEVGGDLKSPLKLGPTDLAAMPRTKVTAKDKSGVDVVFDGVELSEILKRVGAPQGEALRGSALALAVIVTASDHYQAVFALSELDPAMTDKSVILADTVDGKPLAAGIGPFRIVAPDDKRHARWVRMVTRIDVVHVDVPSPGSSAASKP